jgi:hypothetical protein
MPLNHSSKFADLTSPQAEMLGRFVVEWSNIEYLLGELLGRLRFTPSFLSRVYADELSAYKFQSALGQAVRIHRERYGCQAIERHTLDRIDSLRPSLDKLRGMRNRFSHFCWARSNDDEIFGTALSAQLPDEKGDVKDFKVITLSAIREAHEEAWKLVEELSSLISSIPEFTEEEAIRAERFRPI